MAIKRVIKQHDTYPPLLATLSDAVGPINLTTATEVVLKMKTATGTAWTGLGVCAIEDAAAGEVSYDWVAGDTDDINTYNAEFQIEWSNGDISTVPHDSYVTVQVFADLG